MQSNVAPNTNWQNLIQNKKKKKNFNLIGNYDAVVKKKIIVYDKYQGIVYLNTFIL